MGKVIHPEYCDRCGHIKQQCQCEKPKTNADRIRSMSDEELADILPFVYGSMCKPTYECIENIINRGECGKTRECALMWLRSNAE